MSAARPFARLLAGALSAALALAALWQIDRGVERARASRLLSRVEALSLQALLTGQAPRPLMAQNLRDLGRAAELDPLEPGIPLARGSLYLLLGRPHEAWRAYERALEVEPRPEIYLNLGRAQALAGDHEAARESFRRAELLDWHLGEQIPPQLRAPP